MTATALKHKAKAVKGEVIPGTWRAVCSCGWKDWMLYGSKGARSCAIAAAREHAHIRHENAQGH